MALIKCSECGREISDKADACLGCGAPVTVNAKTNREGAATAVHYNPDTDTFSGTMAIMVKLAMRAVHELGWKLDQANEGIGLVTFETKISWGSWSGISCSLNIEEVSPNTFRVTGTGKQNVRGGQLGSFDIFGEAQKKALKVIDKMKTLAVGFPPKLKAAPEPVREPEPEREPGPEPERKPEPRRHAPALHRPSGGW
jgi:hypothetical protein